MSSPDIAELMKDSVHKSVSCQRGSICAWSHPTMHLTRTEIESRLWPPGRDFPGTLVYYSYYCTSAFPKNLFFFFLFAFRLASAPFLSFHQHISFFTEQWKDNGGRNEGTSLLLIVMRKSGGMVLASLVVHPNHVVNFPWHMQEGDEDSCFYTKNCVWTLGAISAIRWTYLFIGCLLCAGLCLALRPKGKDRLLKSSLDWNLWSLTSLWLQTWTFLLETVRGPERWDGLCPRSM